MELITIPGTFPNLDRIIGAAQDRAVYVELVRTYTYAVAIAAKDQRAPVQNYPCSIHIDWYCKDRQFDPDSIAAGKKMIINGLVGAGIIEGNGWEQIHGLSDNFFIDAGHPRVVVSIREKNRQNTNVIDGDDHVIL